MNDEKMKKKKGMWNRTTGEKHRIHFRPYGRHSIFGSKKVRIWAKRRKAKHKRREKKQLERTNRKIIISMHIVYTRYTKADDTKNNIHPKCATANEGTHEQQHIDSIHKILARKCRVPNTNGRVVIQCVFHFFFLTFFCFR